MAAPPNLVTMSPVAGLGETNKEKWGLLIGTGPRGVFTVEVRRAEKAVQ